MTDRELLEEIAQRMRRMETKLDAMAKGAELIAGEIEGAEEPEPDPIRDAFSRIHERNRRKAG